VPSTKVEASDFQEELQRVLASESFRSAEALRRLLAYLAEAHLFGIDRTSRNIRSGVMSWGSRKTSIPESMRRFACK